MAITVSVMGGGGKADNNANGGGTSAVTTTSGSAKPNSDIASANDTGPVAVITEDPSCAPMRPIIDTRSAQQKNGWDKRDPSIPASEWTPEVRAQYEAVAQSMKSSADQLVPIAKLTPHRVMRELYEQAIAYSRAYAESISEYTAADDSLAGTSAAALSAVDKICAAISYNSAATRGPLVPALDAPAGVAPLRNPSEPYRFMTAEDPVCAEWIYTVSQFGTETKTWAGTSPDKPASKWSPEQKSINDGVAPIMSRFADKIGELGAKSTNLTLRDFADLSAQYRRAYVLGLPTYVSGDQFLASTSIRLAGVVQAACQAIRS